MVKVLVGALESDEEVLKRISTTVGTIFNVLGTKYVVTKSSPFAIKKLGARKSEDADSEENVVQEAPETLPQPEPVEAAPAPIEDESPPESERRTVLTSIPSVGERWKPKDPRRKASFVITAIDGDHAVTDDGRRIQIARFKRYERLEDLGPTSKVS